MPGCSVSLTTESFCSVVNRRRRATPVMTSTFENVSDIGLCLGLCLAPPANAGVRSKRGAVHVPSTNIEVQVRCEAKKDRAQCRSSAPNDLREPRRLDETRRTIDPGHSSD